MIALAAVLAGLALFIAGMNTMSRGLQTAAGRGLRRILERATRRRGQGLLLGTLLGGLIQSSAGSVMLVGFISAGLLTLAQAVPVVLGINIGTSLSMMLISLRLGDLCWAAMAAGLTLRILRPQSRAGAIGMALFGFGVIFLGLTVMSDAIRPYRTELAPLLRHADGATLAGMLTGVALATLVTAVIQSSGAVIGMVFAMIAAGVITNLEQAWPIIIGANIGTCATALLGSIGASAAARRSALSHLLFNLFSAAAGMAAAPLVYRYVPLLRPVTAGATLDMARQALIQQCAIANALKMVITALVALPFTPRLAAVVTRLTHGGDRASSSSLLDPELLERPEAALQAALQELSRLSGICRDSLRRQARLYLGPDARRQAAVQADEYMLDTLKLAMHDYLQALSKHPLSRRQGILLTMLYMGIDHLERISDHVARMAEVSQAQRRQPSARFLPATLEAFLDLNQQACRVLTRLQQALVPGSGGDHRAAAAAVIDARDRYMASANRQRAQIASDLSNGRSTPSAVLYRNTYLSHLNRIVKHAKTLALDARDRDFHIKPSKLDGKQGWSR